MEMKSTWLSQPVTLHSSRAFTCEGFETAEQCEWYQHRWHFWYIADWVYALPTIAFCLACISVFVLSNIVHQLLAFFQVTPSPLRYRVTAFVRYLSYRGFRIGALRWNSAPLGLLLLALVGIVYFFCMTLIPQPYYWPGSDTVWGNSPPLGTRSGWMALACMPFVFATASKANWITLVTGVSHEKLQVFHQWISYAFFIMALLHTFPFVIYHFRNSDVVQQFTLNNYFTYWTGSVALIFQTWLTFASFSWVRNLSYEFFKAAHFLSMILFVLIFFWHCGGTLTSWDYFIATAAVYVSSLVFPWLRTIFEYGIGQKARLFTEDNGFVRITIPAKPHWIPGQHCFLRFTGYGIHALSAHPFTICSLPPRSADYPGELVFYVRCRGGFTRKLCDFARKHCGDLVQVLVDGPYGGIDDSKFWDSDRIVLIAGGSGAGWSLPIIEQYLRTQIAGRSLDSVKSLRVILATRDDVTRAWFHQSIAELISRYQPASSPVSALNIEVYLTGEAEQSTLEPDVLTEPKKILSLSAVALSSSPIDEEVAPSEEAQVEQLPFGSSPPTHLCQVSQGRPTLPQTIDEEIAKAGQAGQSVGFFVCGPDEMQYDVRNTVAKSNLQLSLSSSGCKGVYLHLEHFSWA